MGGPGMGLMRECDEHCLKRLFCFRWSTVFAVAVGGGWKGECEKEKKNVGRLERMGLAR